MPKTKLQRFSSTLDGILSTAAGYKGTALTDIFKPSKKQLGVKKKGSLADLKSTVINQLLRKESQQSISNLLDDANISDGYWKEMLVTESLRSRYFARMLENFRVSGNGVSEKEIYVLSKQPPTVSQYVPLTTNFKKMISYDMYRDIHSQTVADVYKQISIKIQVGDFDAGEFSQNARLNGNENEVKPPLQRFGMWFERNHSFYKVKWKGHWTTAFGAFFNTRYLKKFYVKHKNTLVGGWTTDEKASAACQLLQQGRELIQFVLWAKQNNQLLPRGADLSPMVYKDQEGKVCANLVILDIDHASFGNGFNAEDLLWDETEGKSKRVFCDENLHLASSDKKYLKLADAMVASIMNTLFIMIEQLELCPGELRHDLVIPWDVHIWNTSRLDGVKDVRKSIIAAKLKQMGDLINALKSKDLVISQAFYDEKIAVAKLISSKDEYMETEHNIVFDGRCYRSIYYRDDLGLPVGDFDPLKHEHFIIPDTLQHNELKRRRSGFFTRQLSNSDICLHSVSKGNKGRQAKEAKVCLEKTVDLDQVDNAYRDMVKTAVYDMILQQHKNISDNDIESALGDLKTSAAKRKKMPSVIFSLFDSSKANLVEGYAKQFFADVTVVVKSNVGG